jgi:carotenoid cleavage dioxygenase-like enzyme
MSRHRAAERGTQDMTRNDDKGFDRRSFLAAAAGAAAAVTAATTRSALAAAPAGAPAGAPSGPPARTAGTGGQFAPIRAEVTVGDCEVEGKIPSDLSGGFYAVGPDAQYPMRPGNIIFDGEGHARLFRIKGGRVDYRTRYVKSERYVAQDKARKGLFPMYRNPYLDDPSTKGLSRSTANTHVINHKGLILALKEDSPPVALDLNTLETVDPVYTFGGQLPRTQPFTAHPKVCSKTGNIVAFGYEAEGFGSDVVSVFEIDKDTSRKVWEAKVKVPYVGLLHDFAVTENYIAIYVVPLAMDLEQMKRGGIHWSWDATRKTYFGFFRRGGDGRDLKWIEGPARSGTHTMGAFEDKGRIYLDTELTRGNPFPFMPNKDGSPPDLPGSTSILHRLSANLNGKNPKGYDVELLFPLQMPLPKQDDRYNTAHYRYGFGTCPDPNEPNRAAAGSCFARMDIQTKTYKLWNAGTKISLAEPVFAPKNATSREGEGYLIGVAYHLDQNLRSDLLILDAERIEEGPVARVRLPVQASPQVHGWWVREDQYPAA